MKLDYAPPPSEFAELISAFYLFEAELDELEDIERADIAQFRVVLDGKAHLIRPDGTSIPYPDVALFGPRNTATHVVARGPKLKLFGFGLLPAGWARAISMSAQECANQVFAATDIIPFDADQFYAAISACSTLEEMTAITIDRARVYLDDAIVTPLWFVREVDKWLESKLSPDIADLEASTGLSRRQIERLARQYYGAPPKFLVRKYRALRAANAIANGNGDWQQFIDESFYDQSHFIREIKEFTGQTPGAIRESRSPLSMLVFRRAMLAGDVKPLVAST